MRHSTLLLALLCGCGGSSPGGGEWIVFSSGRSGNGDIYAVQTTSDAVRPVINTDASEGTVRYDPVRDRLVYSRFDTTGTMLMSEGGELFPDPNGDVAPVWSSTNRIAYVVESEGTGDLFAAQPDASGVERLTSDDLVERYPAWSPDGDRLVYAKRLESGWDLHVLDLASGEESRITFDGVYVGHPSWSPDGSRIAFDRMYGEQTEIALLDLGSGEIRRLTENEENDLLPAWSGDGSRIAFAGVRDRNWDVWTVTVDGATVERITTDPGFDGGPVFVPATVLD